MNSTTAKGWNNYTNVGHIRAALGVCEIIMVKCPPVDLDEDPENPYLMFLQIEGPWVAKGWRSAYNHTHWMLMHHGQILDINNCGWYGDGDKISWISYGDWENFIMPSLVDLDPGATGWSTKGCYKIVEKEQRRII